MKHHSPIPEEQDEDHVNGRYPSLNGVRSQLNNKLVKKLTITEQVHVRL